MSSLLQHTGRVSRERGVELLIYLVRDEYVYGNTVFPATGLWGEYCSLLKHPIDCEPQELFWNDSKHIMPKLYRIWRKPKGMFGCWVVFRINGEDTIPDLSIPISLHKLPRDAQPLSESEAIKYWQS